MTKMLKKILIVILIIILSNILFVFSNYSQAATDKLVIVLDPRTWAIRPWSNRKWIRRKSSQF